MGDKTKARDADPNYEALAEAVAYLGDQVRAGLDNLSDAVRSRPANSSPGGFDEGFPPHASSNQMTHHGGGSQGKSEASWDWKPGEDEIPDMRDDEPLPDFGRKPGT